MDIAELRLVVDASDLRKATGELDNFQREAKDTQGAASDVERSIDMVGGAALEAARDLSKTTVGLTNLKGGAKDAANATAGLDRGLDAVKQGAGDAAREIKKTVNGLNSFQEEAAQTDDAARRADRGLDALADGAAGATRRVKETAVGLDNLQREARETGAETTKASKGLNSIGVQAATAARNLFAVVGVVQTARAGLNRAEAYTNLTNSLQAMGSTAEEARATLEQIAEVAQRARAPLEGTAKLYTRLSVAAEEVGASQEQVLKFTETVGKALSASGTSAGEASGALLQLSQAMAGGIVRAEEFNSILEGAFPIAQAAANGIEEAAGSVGKLRNLVVEGKISSEEFFNAILSQSDAIDQAFGNTSTTLSQAFTQLGNSVTLLVGGLDGEAGLSGALASVVSEIAMFVDSLRGLDNLPEIAGSIAAVGAAALAIVFPFTAAGIAVAAAGAFLYRNWDDIRARFPGIVGALESGARVIIDTFSGLWDVIGSIGGFALENLGFALDGLDDLLQGDAAAAMEDFAKIGESVKMAFNGLAEAWVPALEAAWGAVTERFGAWVDAAGGYAQQVINGFVRGFKGLGAAMVAEARAAWEALKAELSEWPSRLYDLAVQAVQGFINGMLSMQAEVGSAGRNAMGKRVKDAVEEELDIRSPSRVFQEIGENTVAGFVQGILKEGETAAAAIKEVAGGAIDAGTRLADGVADVFGGLFTGAYEDAEDALGAIKDLFLSTLKDMITEAVRNPIRLIFGGAQGGGLGGAVGGGAQGLFGGFGAGLQSVLKGFGSGGFSGAFGAIGTALKGISGGGLAGIGTALGAVAVPVAAIAAAVSFFQTKTTELDRGLRVTIGNMGTLVESFSKVEKSRFWGLSKTTKTTYDRLGEAAAAPIVRAVQIMQENVIGMAAAVGVGAEAFDDFAFRIKLSTKDRSAQDAVEAALKGAADAMAELAFAGTEGAEDLVAIMKVEKELAAVRAASARAVAASGLTSPNQGPGNVEATRSPEYRAYKSALDEVTSEFDEQIRSLTGQLETLRRTESIYIRDGETASEALTRLSSALTTVNAQFDFMGRALFDVSIAAADMASQLVDLFGTAEDFAVATTRYIELFYSEQERGRMITRSLTEQLMAFNVALPQSRRSLRDLVDSLDLTTDYGRQLYATLIQNADAFDTILPKVENLSIVLQRAFDFAAPLLSEAIAQSNESARAFQQSAQLWYRTADTLRGFIADLRGTDLGGLSGAAQLEFNRRQFEQAAAAARAGDQDAAASLPQLGRAFVESARAQSQTAEQFRAVAAQVASESQLVAGIATLEGAIDTVISDLFTQNSEALQGLADAIEQGGDVEAALEEFGPRIDDLAAAIAGLQELSYDGIRDALDSITVDLRTRDDIPRYLRDVITGDADNLTKTLDFILRRDDLTPEQVFIAANTLSNLTKSVAFVVSERGLTENVVKLALATSGDIRRGLIFAVEKPLPEPLQTFALTSFDTLSRAVLLTLSSDSSNAAKRIALEGLGDYTATVRLALRPESEASERVRRIVFRQAGTYTAGILAALDDNKLSERARRILLRQQGDYIANIRGIVRDQTGETARLLLKRNTEGFREITLSAVYKDGLGAWTDFIRGRADGKVQLGGRVTFDPTQAFEDALSAGISEPFDLATKAMDRLERALARDADLQDEANKYLRLSTLQQRRDAVLSEAQQTIDAIRALEAQYAQYGARILDGNGGSARYAITEEGLLNIVAQGIEFRGNTPAATIQAFKDALAPLEEKLGSFFGIPKGLNNAIGRVSASLGIPGFASGGSFGGGLRIVGENGPELEATGPSRIYSNSDMRKIMSGDPRMMQRLLEAIEAMRREQRQLATQIAQNTSRTSRTLQTWDADGLPAERVDA